MSEKNEMFILGIASITVTTPQSPLQHFLFLFTPLWQIQPQQPQLILREHGCSNAQATLWARDLQVHLHLQKLCCKPTVHRVSVPNNFNNGAIIFLDVGNIKCYKLHLKCCCPFTFFPFYINAGLPMVRKHKNMVKQTTGSSQKSNYSNIRTFYYYDFKLFWASKLLLI